MHTPAQGVMMAPTTLLNSALLLRLLHPRWQLCAGARSAAVHRRQL